MQLNKNLVPIQGYYAGKLSEIEQHAFDMNQQWLQPATPEQIAPDFHHYLTEKDYRINTDFSDKQGQELRTYNGKKITALLTRLPLSKWSGSSKGLITFQDNIFMIHMTPLDEYVEIIYRWTWEFCEYRLHRYFERKGNLG